MAPFPDDLAVRLRRLGELDLDDAGTALLCSMSAATIDRRLAGARSKLLVRGRSYTKPGSLLKDAIPIPTWAQWDDAVPGFVEIDLVGHKGGNASGEHCFTLTVIDIATHWTENRSIRNKARKWMFEALMEIAAAFPFPILGIDSDNGSEFINHHLRRWRVEHHLTFTRSRPRNSNDRAHVEQKLVSKVRNGAKVTKKYDAAATPNQRAQINPGVTKRAKAVLARTYRPLNPAAIQRHIQALAAELLTLTTAHTKPAVND